MIKILCVGKLKENYLKECVKDYWQRIQKYHDIEIIEVKDDFSMEKEGLSLLKHIGTNDYVITLEIDGKMITSEELAQKMQQTFIHYPVITFVIGGSNGLHEMVKARADMALSFSKFTFPHGLFRSILLEQIYRSFKINHHETYHK